MAQVINDPGTGSRLGAALGTGLNQIAQHKLNFLTSQYENELAAQQQRKNQQYLTQLQRQNQAYEKQQYAAGLAPILGQDTANFLSNLGPKEREHALQNISALMQLGKSPTQQAAQEGLGALSGERPETSEQPSDNSRLVEEIFTSPHEKREREKLDLKRQQVENQLGKDVREFSKPFNEKARKSEANIRDYNELIKLVEKGDVRAGNVHQLLKKVGLQDFGRNTDTEKAGKLIARLAQNVAGVFGNNARITNFLEQTFQRSLPDLINTPEGIIAISKINKAVDEGEIIRNNVRKQILKENGGRLTGDIEDQIEARANPQIRSLEDKAFREAENATKKITGQGSKDFQQLPPPQEFTGRKIRDKETGKILQSNGSEWLEV